MRKSSNFLKGAIFFSSFSLFINFSQGIKLRFFPCMFATTNFVHISFRYTCVHIFSLLSLSLALLYLYCECFESVDRSYLVLVSFCTIKVKFISHIFRALQKIIQQLNRNALLYPYIGSPFMRWKALFREYGRGKLTFYTIHLQIANTSSFVRNFYNFAWFLSSFLSLSWALTDSLFFFPLQFQFSVSKSSA